MAKNPSEHKHKVIRALETHFDRNARVISNTKIREFLQEKEIIPGSEDFKILEAYYLRKNLKRPIFQEIREKKAKKKQEDRAKSEQAIENFQGFKDLLVEKNYKEKTFHSYTLCIRMTNSYALNNWQKPIQELNNDDIKAFFTHLMKEKEVAYSTLRSYRFALKLYFREILDRELDFQFFEKVQKNKLVPEILTKEEVEKILQNMMNLKHRTMVALVYGSGLRLSEVLNLKVNDVDMESLTIRIRKGKGKKDRHSLLPERLLNDLKSFVVDKKKTEFLFQSNYPGDNKPLAPRSLQAAFNIAVVASGIKKKVALQTLRHSFATHLLENGVDLANIQALLGHKSRATTSVYKKVANPTINKIKSPL
ncbi:MAG: tyrosine-type recombinase/integrase [Spirochaetota bacterium]